MTTQTNGPPEKERPGARQFARPNQHSAADTTTTTSHRQATGYCHSNGIPPLRPADLFREGFRRGAIDALRLAMRELDDPAAWLVLSRLADRYGGVS